ncbi:MAG: chemotaxis protein CheA, partial [Myxococcaceae bacterium]
MEDVLLQVLAVFAEELREQTTAITDALIRIERSSQVEERRVLMKEVFRHAHSIKGNAGTLGLGDLEELAHAFETALTPFRTGERELIPSLAPALLQALDQAQRRVEGALRGNNEPDPILAQAAIELLRLSAREADPFGGGRKPPPPRKGNEPVTGIAAPAPKPPERRSSDTVETIRVAVERLSALDHQFDDLREVRSALEHRTEEARRIAWTVEAALSSRFEGMDRELTKTLRQQLHLLHRGLLSDVTELSGRLAGADEELRALRMLPVETILAPLSRAVWEHARQVHKLARLELSGAQVALDRRLLQELKDPLVHLARNAVDHGLETLERRQAAGKPAEGMLRIDVEQRGGKVFIAFSDDGAGMDPEKIRQTAIERGLVTSEGAAGLTDAQVYEFVFAPGFSTAQQVTRTSGRGVGLDVVKENVQRLGGMVTLSTVLGKGTRFILELPLTLATAQALLFESCGFVLALPLVAVARSKYLNPAQARAEALDVNGQLLTIHSLSKLLDLKEEEQSLGGRPVVVVKAADRLLAIRV